MQDKLYKSTIALAGIVQAVSLVRDLAQTGKMDEEAYNASIYSIFQTDPPDLPSVYGDLSGVRMGLEKLLLISDPQGTPFQTRYMLSLMHLQKKISAAPKLVKTFSERIAQTKKQVDYFNLTHPTVISNLADIYITTLNTFKFRVVIWGNQRYLSVTSNMEKIRALLLAGLRSAVLWRQMGGSRFQLIFSRAKIKSMAEKILTDLDKNKAHIVTALIKE